MEDPIDMLKKLLQEVDSEKILDGNKITSISKASPLVLIVKWSDGQNAVVNIKAF